MKRYVCWGSKFIKFFPVTDTNVTSRLFRDYSLIVEAESQAEASHLFQERLGIRPEYIDGKAVCGHCEFCMRPIFAGEAYWHDSEGIQLCAEHSPTPEEEASELVANAGRAE